MIGIDDNVKSKSKKKKDHDSNSSQNCNYCVEHYRVVSWNAICINLKLRSGQVCIIVGYRCQLNSHTIDIQNLANHKKLVRLNIHKPYRLSWNRKKFVHRGSPNSI